LNPNTTFKLTMELESKTFQGVGCTKKLTDKSRLRTIWSEKEKRHIFNRTKGKCYICKKELIFEHRKPGLENSWEIEHVFPFSKYPNLDNMGNLLPACISCNRKKSAGDLISF